MTKNERRNAAYRSRCPAIVDLPGEEWRVVREEWEVSNLGRFKSTYHESDGADGKVRRLRPRLITVHNGSVRMHVGGREAQSTTCSLWHLMYEAFIGEVPNGFRVALKDPYGHDTPTPDRLALYPYRTDHDPTDQAVVPRLKLKRTDPGATLASYPKALAACRRNIAIANARIASGELIATQKGIMRR